MRPCPLQPFNYYREVSERSISANRSHRTYPSMSADASNPLIPLERPGLPLRSPASPARCRCGRSIHTKPDTKKSPGVNRRPLAVPLQVKCITRSADFPGTCPQESCAIQLTRRSPAEQSEPSRVASYRLMPISLELNLPRQRAPVFLQK
jgi:hypothetical protein